jgi:HPt (histidine-containing phosphotransfer) domain-containing protein
VDEGVLAGLRDLGADDPAFFPGLLEEFLKHAARAIQRLRDGAAKRDATALQETAHGLKGSAGSLGARRLSELCADLDVRVRSGHVVDADARVAGIAKEANRVRARLLLLLDRRGGAR